MDLERSHADANGPLLGVGTLPEIGQSRAPHDVTHVVLPILDLRQPERVRRVRDVFEEGHEGPVVVVWQGLGEQEILSSSRLFQRCAVESKFN